MRRAPIIGDPVYLEARGWASALQRLRGSWRRAWTPRVPPDPVDQCSEVRGPQAWTCCIVNQHPVLVVRCTGQRLERIRDGVAALRATGAGQDPRIACLVESVEAPVACGKRHDDAADRSFRE